MVSFVLHPMLTQAKRLCVLREYANNVGELEQAAYRRLHRILVSTSWSNSSVLRWHKSKLHKRCQVSRESLKVWDAFRGVFDAKAERLSFDRATDMMLPRLRVFVCVESAVDGKYWHVWWWIALRAVDNNSKVAVNMVRYFGLISNKMRNRFPGVFTWKRFFQNFMIESLSSKGKVS